MAGIAAGAGAGAGAGAATSLFTATGVGIGAVFVTVALVLLLAYQNLVEADENADDRARRIATALTLPLLATFVAVVVFEAMAF
ncbi:MAG: hypothetical protein V5A55_07245 [Halovenus sp.]